tara:strand:- start:2527 stop:2694 length:168 start_codon:yes stop_codon:yes gene_type:complete
MDSLDEKVEKITVLANGLMARHTFDLSAADTMYVVQEVCRRVSHRFDFVNGEDPF